MYTGPETNYWLKLCPFLRLVTTRFQALFWWAKRSVLEKSEASEKTSSKTR